MSETQGSSIEAGTETADHPLGRGVLRRYATSPGLVSREVPSRAGMMAAAFSIDRAHFLASVLRRWAGVKGPTADWAALVDRWHYFGRERNQVESPIASSGNRPTATISRQVAQGIEGIRGRIDAVSASPAVSVESPAAVHEGSTKSAAAQPAATDEKSSSNHASTSGEFALPTGAPNDQSGRDATAAAAIKPAVTIQAPPIIKRQPRHVARETISVDSASSSSSASGEVSGQGANGVTADGRTASSGQFPETAPAELNQHAIARPKVIHRTVEIGRTSRRQISTSIANPARANSEAPPILTRELPPVSSTAAHPNVAKEAPVTPNSVERWVKPEAGHDQISDGGPESKNVNAADSLHSTSSISAIQAGQHILDIRQIARLNPGSNPLPAIHLRRGATSSRQRGGGNAPILTRHTELAGPKSSAGTSTCESAIGQNPSISISSISGTQADQHTQDSGETTSLSPGSNPLPAIHLRRSATSTPRGGGDNAPILTRATELGGPKSSAGTSTSESAISQNRSTAISSISGTQSGRHTQDSHETTSLNPGSNPLPAIHLRRSATSTPQDAGDNIPVATRATDLGGNDSSAGIAPRETATSANRASNSPVLAPAESIAMKSRALSVALLPAASIELSHLIAESRPEHIMLTHPRSPLSRSAVSTASDSSVEAMSNHRLSKHSSANSDVPELAEGIMRRYRQPSSQSHLMRQSNRGMNNTLIDLNKTSASFHSLASVTGQPPVKLSIIGIPVISLPHAEGATSHGDHSDKDANSPALLNSNPASHGASSRGISTVNGNDTHVASPAAPISRGRLISRTPRSFPEPFKPISSPNGVIVSNVDTKSSLVYSPSHLATRNADHIRGYMPTLPASPPSATLANAALSMELYGVAAPTAFPQLVIEPPKARAHLGARAAAANPQVWRSPIARTPSNIYRESTQLSHRVLRSAAIAPSSTVQPPNADTAAAGLPSHLPSVGSVSGAVPDKAWSGKANLTQLAEQVYRLLARRLANERERRGS